MLHIQKKARIVRGLRPCGVFLIQNFSMKPNFVNAILFALLPTGRGTDARDLIGGRVAEGVAAEGDDDAPGTRRALIFL